MPTHPGKLPANVSLRRLFSEATLIGAEDIVVASATDDSRAVQPGQCYVALRGIHCDGHAFVQEALHRGASALLVARAEPGVDCPQCVVPDTRAAWGQLCQALMGNPAEHLSVVGVTGTNGKTTTTLLVRQILGQARLRCGLIGTLEYHDGVRGMESHLTTPSSPMVAHWLSRMVQCGTTHVAIEVSSHALCQHRLAGVNLDVAVVTNITGDHLDYHGTFEAYRQSKRRIFSHLAQGGTAVVNVDDPQSGAFCAYLHEIAGRGAAVQRILTFGVEADADVTAALVDSSSEGQRFRLGVGGETADVRIGLVGLHNVSNCLAAAAVAHHYGIGVGEIVSGLESLASIPGRLEPVACGGGFRVFVDYAHTDDALRRVLRSLRPLVAGRLICVFGAGGDRDRQKRPRMAHAVETGADVAIVTSDNPRGESPEAIIGEILAGFSDPQLPHVEPDRRKAIRLALELAAQGDAVLIAGKGHESHQIVGAACLEFDDRQVAREEAWQLYSRRRRSKTAEQLLKAV